MLWTQCGVDHGCLLLTMTPVLTSKHLPHACTPSQPPNMRSTLHESPLLYGAEGLLKYCNVGAIKGGASGFEFGVGGAVSSVYVHCGTLLNTPVVLYKCGVCDESSINSTHKCFLSYLQTRRSETFRALTMRTASFIPIGHSTTLRPFVK